MDIEANNVSFGSSKYRRLQINKAIELMKKAMPLSDDELKKLSQLQALHYACIYIRKEQLVRNLIEHRTIDMNQHQMNASTLQYYFGQNLDFADLTHGFMIVLSKQGHLIYVSENVINYLGLPAMDILLSADKFTDILHPSDEIVVKNALEGGQSEVDFYTSWYVSKIKRRVHSRSDTKVIKIKGCLTNDNNLFIGYCTPILRTINRDYLVAASPTCFTTAHSLDLKFLETCEKAEGLLGYRRYELIGFNLYQIVNSANLDLLRKRHKTLLNNKSQKGKLDRIQLLMKDGSFVNCLVNMYFCNSSNSIICKFQILGNAEACEYDEYMNIITGYSNTDDNEMQRSECTQSSPRVSNDESDFNGQYSSSGSGGGKKRNAREMHEYDDDDEDYDEIDNSTDSEESQFEEPIKRQRLIPAKKIKKEINNPVENTANCSSFVNSPSSSLYTGYSSPSAPSPNVSSQNTPSPYDFVNNQQMIQFAVFNQPQQQQQQQFSQTQESLMYNLQYAQQTLQFDHQQHYHHHHNHHQHQQQRELTTCDNMVPPVCSNEFSELFNQTMLFNNNNFLNCINSSENLFDFENINLNDLINSKCLASTMSDNYLFSVNDESNSSSSTGLYPTGNSPDIKYQPTIDRIEFNFNDDDYLDDLLSVIKNEIK